MNPALIAALAAVGGLLLMIPRTETDKGTIVDMTKPRGIRNHNPGNLENNGIGWQGLAAQQTDPRFYQFTAPVWGIRALARTLKTYRERHGLTTPHDIISRWAPSFENNVYAYASAVASALGVDMYDYFDDTPANRLALVKAIIRHENGQQPYPDSLIREGIARAYA